MGGAAYPQSMTMQTIPFTQVKITDTFWAPRREANRQISLPLSLDKLAEAGNLRNLEFAAAEATEGFAGPVFADSDVYKALEAVSYSLATHPDPELERRADAIIAQVAAAQRPDGYLNTAYQVERGLDKRWTDLREDHELYCAGHLFEAAVAHFQATGKRTLLDVAVKFADHIAARFGDGPGKRPGYPGHPEVELALIETRARHRRAALLRPRPLLHCPPGRDSSLRPNMVRRRTSIMASTGRTNCPSVNIPSLSAMPSGRATCTAPWWTWRRRRATPDFWEWPSACGTTP